MMLGRHLSRADYRGMPMARRSDPRPTHEPFPMIRPQPIAGLAHTVCHIDRGHWRGVRKVVDGFFRSRDGQPLPMPLGFMGLTMARRKP